MNNIILMTFLGIIGGMLACLWTRITRKNMLLRKLGRWLEVRNNRHVMEHNCDSIWMMLLRCSFCISVWLVLVLELWYVITFAPHWTSVIIGGIGGIGAGNTVCEMVRAFRNEAL